MLNALFILTIEHQMPKTKTDTDSQLPAASLPFDELCSRESAARAFHSLLCDLAGLAGSRAQAAENVLHELEKMPADCPLALNLRQCLAASDAVRAASGLSKPKISGARAGIAAASQAGAQKLAILETLRWYGRAHSATPPNRTVRVGGRKSSLSLAQLDEMNEYLRALAPHIALDFVSMDTPGDRNKTTPLSIVTDDDFFTRDLDNALRNREIDLAVHSAKDLPNRLPAGLLLAAVTPSLLPAECLVTRDGATLAHLRPGAVIGISSERRRSTLLALRPDLHVADIRGNVPDRIRQVDSGRYDAVVLAAVGLTRLGLQDRIAQTFTGSEFPHAAGQGQLALMVREDDAELAAFLEPLDLGDRAGMPWAEAT